MKHQQVSVDYWTMGKAMFVYLVMTAMGWLMLRLFNTVIIFPRRMQSQHENLKTTLNELQNRFPNMNITEEDLKNAEKELEEFIKEEEEKKEALEYNAEESDENENNKKTK